MSNDNLDVIKQSIQTIPDYPKPGILFRDVTSLMEDPTAYQATIDALAAQYRDQGFTKVIGTESRGFFIWCAIGVSTGTALCACPQAGQAAT